MRPIRTDEIVEKIIEGISKGIPMTRICREKGMPAPRTVREWMEKDEALSAAIARARELGFDALAEEALDIIDAEPEMVTGDGGSRRDAGYVAWQKARVETRLKLLAKWDPKRYGELIKHGNADGTNLDLASGIEQARERALRGQ